jgi:hypothetical protein
MEEHGYVVYDNVLAQDELTHSMDLLWKYLEGLGTGIVRDDPATWKDSNWLPDGGKGILFTNSIGQSEFLWYLRGRPLVADIFASLWECPVSELITSFDGACFMRPISYDINWRTAGAWYHVDQNGVNKKGKQCFQGLMNIIDCSDPTSPGLVVCPGSHKKFASYFETFPGAGKMGTVDKGDFVTIKPNQLLDFYHVRPIRLCVPAGAFVVWDSRTIHCNAPADIPLGVQHTVQPKTLPDRVVA